ncbi:MAG: NERD domain-containing protein/DEAD/DEAH box helicase [Deltaproteobacteria bacterium]|nr:NERD domain-containing protein/DEAD/DEAH box helicase [Deltaproteobacteria bacterium]
MAHMNPDTPPEPGPGRMAEAALWAALKQGLDDDFQVYYRFGYDAGGRKADGEADFLVVHRELGLLAVECKGHGVEYASNAWWRVEGGARKPLKESPFEQARRHAHEIARELTGRGKDVFPDLKRLPFAFHYAVAFPRHEWKPGSLPLDARAEILIDSRDLATVGDKVRAALELGRVKAGAVEPLDPRAFKRFRKQVIAPNFGLVETIGARVRSGETAMARLSDEQRAAARGWVENRRLRIEGGAGTGKTLAAVEAACHMAAQGSEALLLCFNRALAEHLVACVGDREPGPGQVEAMSFHGLCARAYEVSGKKMHVPAKDPERAAFWNEEAPYALLGAVAEGHIARRDAVVVDEGQDFAGPWWDVVQALLRDPDKGRVMVFYDPDQDIFGRGSYVPEWPMLRLTRNFRNTRRISDLVCRLGRVEMESAWGCPEGEEPQVEPQGSKADTRKRLESLVARLVGKEGLLPDQIVIITPHSRPNSSLDGLTEIAGVRLADVRSERDGCLLHSTIGAYKGLESDVVILLDLEPEDPRSNQNARYVAASRSRHALYVLCKGELVGSR